MKVAEKEKLPRLLHTQECMSAEPIVHLIETKSTFLAWPYKHGKKKSLNNLLNWPNNYSRIAAQTNASGSADNKKLVAAH